VWEHIHSTGEIFSGIPPDEFLAGRRFEGNHAMKTIAEVAIETSAYTQFTRWKTREDLPVSYAEKEQNHIDSFYFPCST
jgi:hypothetical protein